MGTYRVQSNGYAPKGLAVGDLVVTGAGTYQIDGVRSDGSYSSHIYNKGQTTASYTGRYDDPNDKKTTQTFGKNLYRSLERIESNKNDTLNMLDSQKEELNKGYDKNAQNIYANYMMNNKNLNEQLVRAGLSESGMTESSQIASNAAYGANLTENETSRNMALKQIDDAKVQVERDASDAEAEAYSNYDNSMLSYNQQKDAEWKQEQANNKISMQTKLGNSIGTGYVPTDEELATAGWTREYYNSLNETAIYNNTSGDMRNQLAAVAGTGYVPTDEELAKAGWTRGYWDSLNKAATPQKTYSGGGGTPTKTSYTYGAMLSEIQNSSNPMETYNQLLPYMSATEQEKLLELATGLDDDVKLKEMGSIQLTSYERKMYDNIKKWGTSDIDALINNIKGMSRAGFGYTAQNIDNVLAVLVFDGIIDMPTAQEIGNAI